MRIDYIETKNAQSGFESLSNKKSWVKPDIEIIGIESGNTAGGIEGNKTIDFTGVPPLTGIYTGSS